MAKMSCENIRLGNNGEFSLITLVSLPGSGNTWIRFLLDRLFGVYSGSLTFDKSLYKGGFRGENNEFESRKSIVTKAHKHISNAEAGLLLIRNPYDAALAEFNRQGNGHTGHATKADFKTSKWTNHVIHSADRWYKLYKKYIESVPVEVFLFENVKLNMEKELSRVARFVNKINKIRNNRTIDSIHNLQ